MHRHRLAAAAAAAVLAAGLAPGTACAAPYPVGPPSSSVSNGSVADGGYVVFSGSGFLPGETVSIRVAFGGADSGAAFTGARGGFTLAALSTLSTVADARGSFRIRIRLSQVGRATLTATGLTSGVTLTQIIEVLPAAPGGGRTPTGAAPATPPDGGPLPKTGRSGRPLLLTVAAGVGAVLTGSALLLLVRSRRRTPAPPR